MYSLRTELRYFVAAIQVLTRVPAPQLPGFAPVWLQRGVKYFPLVGALVGALCAIVLLGASALWSGVLPALLSTAFGIALTGAFHEDGLADFFDSFGGSDRETRLAIMKDSHLGVYGALALGLAISAKVSSLAALPLTVAWAALIAAHAGGRLAAVAVISVLPYSGEVSAAKIKPLGHGFVRSDLGIAIACGLLPALLLPFSTGLVACLTGIVAAVAVAWIARWLLGGYTGDVLGAVEQSYEIAFLLGAAACV
jgi:adenosylcobinamide-GDP ribazoletransferase